jgi:hypothetical protein
MTIPTTNADFIGFDIDGLPHRTVWQNTIYVTPFKLRHDAQYGK